MSKKKKIVVLASMVALLVLTGCLNYFLNRPASQPANADAVASYSDYFAASRANRATSREETKMYYQTIIASEATSAEAKANAEAELATLANNIGLETRLETLIRSIGFDDCIVTVGSDKINVIVKTASITDGEANRLMEMVCTETGKGVGQVRVKPLDV